MKFLIFILCLSTNLVAAQYRFLKLENSQLFFEKVYDSEALNKAEIQDLILESLPTKKDVSNVSLLNELILAEVKNTKIDFKKCGGKLLTTSLIHPLSGEVTFFFKDNKYKVIVNNLILNVGSFGPIECSSFMTKNNLSEFNFNRNVLTDGKCIESHLDKLFTIKQKEIDW